MAAGHLARRAGRLRPARDLTALRGGLRIGTSGWHYPHWRGVFYPPGLPAGRWLAYYARHFDCVEVNNAFYRLPTADTVARWCAATPEGFEFALKASRFLTHRKRLLDAGDALARVLDTLERFGTRRGPLLFQLPPRWHRNTGRLAAFLALLPAGLPVAFEFRDPSWHHPEVYRLLERHGAGFCLFELGALRSPLVVTAPLVYVRLHGPQVYAGRYHGNRLRAWARRLTGWRRQGHVVRVYFDNDAEGQAVSDALRLKRLCTEMMDGD